jgi:nucleoid-associated protein YgaU
VVLMVPGLIGGKNAPESRIATAPPAAQPAQAPVAPAQHASPPAVDIAMPAPAERNAPSPPLRPASVQPDTPASDASQPGGRSAPVAGSRYRVVRGDMLSDIAFQVYHDASKFRLIQAANPSIRNKDRILVDQVIFIPQDSR